MYWEKNVNWHDSFFIQNIAVDVRLYCKIWLSLKSFSVNSTAFLFFRLGEVLNNIINDCTVVRDDEFSLEIEQNILSSGNDEEDFASEDGDCSTEDEDDCCDGNRVYNDKDLNHSKDL